MTESRTLEIEGVRYTVRGLIFEELVHLGQEGIAGKDEQTVIKEITQCCLVAPKKNFYEIDSMNREVLTELARAVLKMA
jgi:hypothetical protein